MNGIEALYEFLSPGDAVVMFSPVNRHYFSRFRSSDGVLLVLKGKAFLFLDSRYYEMGCIRKEQGILPASVEVCEACFGETFRKFLDSGEIRRAYYEDEELSVASFRAMEARYPGVELLPLGKRAEEIRMVKTPEEIRRIRASQALAEETFAYILPRLEQGRTESAVAAEMEYYMKLHGASGPSFETICVGGTRSSLPHGRAEEISLGPGFLTMDFGCMLEGYASDMTRTVCLGKADEEMKQVYETVLAAQLAALSAVRAGVLGKDVDEAARSVIRSAGFGSYFGHSTGHGIGLQVHEAPSFSPRYEKPIPAYAVLSVEPGIYLPGRFGVRIEDLVVVTDSGSENLNQSTKKLLEL